MSISVAIALISLIGQASIENRSFDLSDRRASHVLVDSGYPIRDFTIQVAVTCRAPGRVLDTVGIDAAPKGSWMLEVAANRSVTFGLWDGSNWHFAVSTDTITLNKEELIDVTRMSGDISVSINGVVSAKLNQTTDLSGRRIFVGDYKGDERFGDKYDIYQAMTGRVLVKYIGPPRLAAAKPSVYRAGQTMFFFHPESRLYMTAKFEASSLEVICGTESGDAKREFKSNLLPQPGDSGPSGTSTFDGGGGGDVAFQFDSAARTVTTLWRPKQGPEKWMVWCRVAKIGSKSPLTPEEINVLNGETR